MLLTAYSDFSTAASSVLPGWKRAVLDCRETGGVSVFWQEECLHHGLEKR